jgi:serine/threonine-protein kinase
MLADRYRVLRRLGSGGMATVLLAEDDRLGRRVAVKRLHTGSPEEAADRLNREARLGASLNHPNLVTVYDAQPDGESLLIVMEFVDGSSLAGQLKHGPLPEERAIEVLRGIAAGLDHVHERGVVHRDVKPSNVLISAGGQVKLADLGIAKALEDTGLTQSGVVLGTLRYIAPEQLVGEPVGPAADVYALALIAYEALSGGRVRKGGALSEILRQSEQAPPDLRAERPGTPAAAANLLSGALARDPADRPGSATGFVEDLATALQRRGDPASAGAAAAPPPPPEPSAPPAAASEPPDTGERSRDARRLAVPGALLLAMLALAAVLILAGGGEDEGSGEGDAVATQERTGGGAGGQEGSGGSGGAAATEAPETPAEAQTEPAPAPEEPAPAAGAPEAGSEATSGDPAATVQDFYELAAAGDYDAARALTTPAFVGAIGGCCDQFDTLESVEFTSLDTVEEGSGTATVSFSDVATHSDRVDQCQGEATLIDQGGWRLDGIAVDCV